MSHTGTKADLSLQRWFVRKENLAMDRRGASPQRFTHVLGEMLEHEIETDADSVLGAPVDGDGMHQPGGKYHHAPFLDLKPYLIADIFVPFLCRRQDAGGLRPWIGKHDLPGVCRQGD